MSAGHAGTVEAGARVTRAWQVLAPLGVRRTSARALVISTLAESASHLTVTAIHERISGAHPEINISTVHRTVAFLVDKGVAHVLPYPGEARYGLADDPHHHAVCYVCGRVAEIPARALKPVVAAVERSSSFQLAESGQALFGRCPDCAARAD